MKYRKLSPTGDYTTGQRDQNFVTGVEAVAQAVLTRLRLWQGEWWENLLDGLPMTQQILGKRAALNLIESLIKERILGTIGVLSIQAIEVTWDNETRALGVFSTINTIYGKATISEVKL